MGLIVNVFRAANERDCTNNGVSSRFATLTLINAEGPFDPTPERPAAMLRVGPYNSIHIVPCTDDGQVLPGWFMMGGNYAATSDSRFGEAVRDMIGTKHVGAVAIHDRQE